MTFISCDFRDTLGNALRRGGYTLLSGLAVSGGRGDIWGRNGRVIVAHDGFTPRRTTPFNPVALQDAFDTHLQGVLARLRDLRNSLGPQARIDIIFRGGGCLKLPERFLEECRALGITVHVLDPLEVLFRVADSPLDEFVAPDPPRRDRPEGHEAGYHEEWPDRYQQGNAK